MRKKYYVADFETATTSPTYVWGWGIVEIGNLDNIQFGSSMSSFLHDCPNNAIVYMHNLKFDGSFHCDYFLRNGYEWTSERKLSVKQFSSIISKDRLWYVVKVNYEGKAIEFRDSLKKLPFSVEKIGRDFLHESEEKKGSIDYAVYRAEGAELSQKDKEYIAKDIIIVAKALEYLIEQGQTSLTTGADALKKYKQIMGNEFKLLFPILSDEIHQQIRASYRGGWTYINNKYVNVDINTPGVVYDVNSLYPDRMANCSYPCGNAVFFEGQYEPNEQYSLYIQRFRAMFTLKPGKLPTIQIKNNRFFVPNQYVTDSEGIVDLTLTSVDFELFQEHYDIHEIQYVCGYMFRAVSGVFQDYIYPLYEARQKVTGAEKALYKLLLNALYGKFAKSIDTSQIVPYFDEEKDIVKYNKILPQTSPPVYMPVGTYITAYAREKTIRTAQKIHDLGQFIYADTDSIHMIGTAPDWLDIHNKRLGAWKLENEFTRAKFIRPKRYIEIGENETVVKCCGLNEKAKQSITWENFHMGAEFEGNLKGRIVPGGTILLDGGFKLQ